MIITAKFASVCPCCNVRIATGSRVEWTKGSKARHVTCTGPAIASASPGRAYRNGANGGRVDCRKYGWDGVVGSSSYYTSGQYDEDS
jgi:hypothetical protein